MRLKRDSLGLLSAQHPAPLAIASGVPLRHAVHDLRSRPGIACHYMPGMLGARLSDCGVSRRSEQAPPAAGVSERGAVVAW